LKVLKLFNIVIVPPLSVIGPVPRPDVLAVLLARTIALLLMDVPPLKLLALAIVSVPVPVLASEPVPAIEPVPPST
jgi:hypothetical protein